MVQVKEFQKWIIDPDPVLSNTVDYKTKEEAYVKTRRMLRKKFPNHHDLAIKLTNDDGRWTLWLDFNFIERKFICEKKS